MAKAQARADAGSIVAALFELTVDGAAIARFSELVAIVSRAEPDDLTGKLLKKLPGRRNPPTITLRRGLTTDLALSSWHEAAVAGNTAEARKRAELTIVAADGTAIARYQLENAWPSRLEVGALEVRPGEALMETVTLTCEDIQRVTV